MQMFKKLAFFAIVVSLGLSLVLTGCSTKSASLPPANTIPTNNEPVEVRETSLVYGIIPHENPESLLVERKFFKEYLEKELGVPVQIFIATDYTGVVEAMKSNKIDFAEFGPFSYVLAREQADAEVATIMVTKKTNKPYYTGYLIATPEVATKLNITTPLEGIEGMKQLATILSNHKKEFTFTFTDPASTSGHGAPRFYMNEGGISNVDDWFKKVGFVGSHDASILGIQNKTADIGATNNNNLELLLQKGKADTSKIVIIWKSPDIPESPVAYRKTLSSQMKKDIVAALLKCPEEIIKDMGLARFESTTDAMYDDVVKMKNYIDTIE